MIGGINPNTISYISWKKAIRFGTHPYEIKVLEKRHPIRAFIGWYRDLKYFGHFYPATVIIHGASGQRMKTIGCNSNSRAEQLCKQLNQQLTEWVESRNKYCA
jgi:hypothetical protein